MISFCLPGYNFEEISDKLIELGFKPAKLLQPSKGLSRVVYRDRSSLVVIKKGNPTNYPHEIDFVGAEDTYESVKKALPLKIEASREILASFMIEDHMRELNQKSKN